MAPLILSKEDTRIVSGRKDQPALGQGYRLNTYLGQVLSIGFLCSYSTMLHYPLIRSKLLSTITSVVTKAPGAIDQVLLRKANKILCLQESDKALVSDVILIWPLRTQVAMESPRGRFEQHLTWVEGSGGAGFKFVVFFRKFSEWGHLTSLFCSNCECQTRLKRIQS